MKSKLCVNCRGKRVYIFKKRSFKYFRCKKCGLVSTYPILSIEETTAYYDNQFVHGNYKLLHKYASAYRSVYKEFAKLLTQAVISSGKPMKGLKVLDVGCFIGDFLLILQKIGADVYGVELQSEAAKIASKKIHRKVIQVDILKHNFGKQKFGVISLLGLLEHVENPHLLLKRMDRLLESGGFLLIQTPNSESIFAQLFGKYWPPYTPVEHVHIYTKGSLIKTLEKFGYKIITVKNHWKNLPLEYVVNMFKIFGPEYYPILKNIFKLIPERVKKKKMKFFIGEIILLAVKK